MPTCIVDYSSAEQDDGQLETELDKADVVGVSIMVSSVDIMCIVSGVHCVCCG